MKLLTRLKNHLALSVIGGALLALAAPLNLHAQTVAAGSADPDFSKVNNTEGSVIQVTTQRDGKIVALGNFTRQTTQTSFVRLNIDGSEDTTFIRLGISIPGGNATAFAVQADGKIIYVGTGASDGNTTAAVGRITATGGKDSDFAPGSVLSNTVSSFYAVALQSDGKIFVGGNFTQYDGQPAPGIVRLNTDGSLDSTFAPPSSADIAFSRVLAIAVQADSKVLVAGNLTYFGDSIQGLLRLNADGSQDTSFSVVLVDKLTSINHIPLLVQPSGKIVLGGDFNVVAGSAHPYLTRLNPDGSLDSAFFATVDAPVLSLAGQGGFDDLIIGGYFTQVSGTARLNVARLDSNGNLDPAFDPGTGPGGGGTFDVKTVAIQADGKVLAGGSFAGFGTATRDNLARLLNNFTGVSIGFGVPGLSNLWLAGTAPGTTASTGQDTLVNATPSLIHGVNLIDGATLNIIAQGGVVNDPANPVSVGPDGGDFLGTTFAAHPAENGLAGLTAPYNSLVGVFLDDSTPSAADTPPAALDFSGAGIPGGIDAATIAPALRQPFFVGDGLTPGGDLQKFIVPAGATRLYLGSFDQSDNENNTGSFGGNVLLVSGTGGGGGTGLTATTLKVNGSDQPTDVTPGSSLSFIAEQNFSPSDAVTVRVQSAPSATGPWTDVPGAVLPFVGSGTFVGSSAVYPATAGIYFRAVATATGVTGESDSDAVGPFFGGTQPPVGTGAVLTVNPGDFSFSIKNQPNAASVVPGDQITYSLTVRNTGAAAATNVVVQANFDSKLTKYTSASDRGTKVGNVVTWTIPTLDKGSNITLTYSVKVLNDVDTTSGITAGANALSATADTPTRALTTADLASSISLRIVPLFNISTANNGSATIAGGQLTFIFTISNRGPDPVTNITADVRLPDGYLPSNFKTATLVDGSGNPTGSPFALGAATNGQTDPSVVRVPISSLGAGQNQRFAVTVNVPYDAVPGSTVNLASVRLNGTNSTGAVSYTQSNYGAKISSLAPATPPSLALYKLTPDGVQLANIANVSPSLLAELNSTFPGLSADPLAVGATINPFLGRDVNSNGSPIFSVPSPTAKQAAAQSANPPVYSPYVLFALVYINGAAAVNNPNDGRATMITIEDTLPVGLSLVPDSVQLFGKKADTTINASGRKLHFEVKNVKAGQAGLILYQAYVPAQAAGGPAPDTIIQTPRAVLTTASLSSQVFSNPNEDPTAGTRANGKQPKIYTPEQILISGSVHASVQSQQASGKTIPFSDGSTASAATGGRVKAATAAANHAVYQIFYKNDGGKKVNDFKVVSEVPTGASYLRGVFLNLNLSERGSGNTSIGERIDPPSPANGNAAVFHLGTLRPGDQGFVQVEYTTDTQGNLVHNYHVDTGSGNGTALAAPSGRVARGHDGGRIAHDAGAPTSAFPGAPNNALVRAPQPGTTDFVPQLGVVRQVPQAVQEGGTFDYTITAVAQGQISQLNPITSQQHLPSAVAVVMDVPAGAEFVSSTLFGSSVKSNGATTYVLGIIPVLSDESAAAATITLRAKVAAGGSLVSRNCLLITAPVPLTVSSGDAKTLVLSAADYAAFYKNQSQIVTSLLGSDAVGTINSSTIKQIQANSLLTTVANADGYSLNSGVIIIPTNVTRSNVVVFGPSSLIAQGGGNLVAQGGGNLIAQGGGNLIGISDPAFASANSIAALIGQDGGGLVAQGGGNIFHDGSQLIGQDGGGFRALAGSVAFSESLLNSVSLAASGQANLIAQGAGNLVAQGAGNLVAQGAGNLVATGGGNLVATGGGNLVAQGTGNLTGQSAPGGRAARGATVIRRASRVPGGTVQGSPDNSQFFHIQKNGNILRAGNGLGGGVNPGQQ